MSKKKHKPSPATTPPPGRIKPVVPAPKIQRTKALPVEEPDFIASPPPFEGFTWVIGGALLLLAAFIYVRTRHFGFVLDDLIVYSQNNFVQKGFKGWGDIFANESFLGYFKDQKNLLSGGRYRPLSLATFAAEVGLWGGDAGRAHLINWVLYAVNSWMVYLVARKLLSHLVQSPMAYWLAGAAALLFLAHPVHVEAVANIKGRDEILCLTFALGALLALIKWAELGSKAWLIVGCTSYLLSLLSKESSIILPVLFPGVLYIIKRTRNRVWTSFFLISGVALIYLIMRYNAVGFFLTSGRGTEDNVLLNNPYLGLNWVEKLPNIFNLVWEYTRLTVWPVTLSHDYYPWQIPLQSWSSPGVWAGFLITVAWVYATVRSVRNRHWTGFALAWVLLSILLISNLFINVGTTMNERFLYFAGFGLALLMAYLMAWGIQRGRLKWPVIVLFGLLFFFWIYRSYTRVPDWRDDFTLNQSGVKGSPNSARANMFLGVSYFNKYKAGQEPDKSMEQLKLADQYIQRALNIIPDYGDALNMKAGVAAEFYAADKDVGKLLAVFAQTMEQKPTLPFGREYLKYLAKGGFEPALIPFFIKTTRAIMASGRYADAREMLGFGLNLFPNHPQLMQMVQEINKPQ